MFGIEYLIAFIKIFVQIGFSIVMAIPFAICWNNLIPKYLGFIPESYQHIPYWHIVGLFIIIYIIGEQIQHLVPTIVNIKQVETKKS